MVLREWPRLPIQGAQGILVAQHDARVAHMTNVHLAVADKCHCGCCARRAWQSCCCAGPFFCKRGEILVRFCFNLFDSVSTNRNGRLSEVFTLFPPHCFVCGYVALPDGTQHIRIIVRPKCLLVDDLSHQVLLGIGCGLCPTAKRVKICCEISPCTGLWTFLGFSLTHAHRRCRRRQTRGRTRPPIAGRRPRRNPPCTFSRPGSSDLKNGAVR